MFKLRHLLLSVAVLLLPCGDAYAQSSATVGAISGNTVGKIWNAVACNASSTARTYTFPTGLASTYEILNIQMNFTRVAATDVQVSCETSLDNSVSWGNLTSCAVTAGVGDCNNAVLKMGTAASDNWMFRFDISGTADLRCTFTCTSGGASDLLTAYGRLVSK